MSPLNSLELRYSSVPPAILIETGFSVLLPLCHIQLRGIASDLDDAFRLYLQVSANLLKQRYCGDPTEDIQFRQCADVKMCGTAQNDASGTVTTCDAVHFGRQLSAL